MVGVVGKRSMCPRVRGFQTGSPQSLPRSRPSSMPHGGGEVEGAGEVVAVGGEGEEGREAGAGEARISSSACKAAWGR